MRFDFSVTDKARCLVRGEPAGLVHLERIFVPSLPDHDPSVAIVNTVAYTAE